MQQRDRVALVTGGSRGLGAAIARRLAADGLRVAVNFSRSRPPAEALVAEIAESSARHLGRWGITVNTVAPGWVPVERHADVGQPERDGYAAQVPLRRQGTPEEVAAAVAFLASDAAGFVTGERIRVNGGHGRV